jgi:hypothetical protein
MAEGLGVYFGIQNTLEITALKIHAGVITTAAKTRKRGRCIQDFYLLPSNWQISSTLRILKMVQKLESFIISQRESMFPKQRTLKSYWSH